jgi:hypothetical protein
MYSARDESTTTKIKASRKFSVCDPKSLNFLPPHLRHKFREKGQMISTTRVVVSGNCLVHLPTDVYECEQLSRMWLEGSSKTPPCYRTPITRLQLLTASHAGLLRPTLGQSAAPADHRR